MVLDASLMQGNWNYPTTVWFGNGRVKETAAACQQLNVKKPLLVTGDDLLALDMLQALIADLREQGLHPEIFTGFKPNPTGENINAGVKAYLSKQCDGVIAVGGGSSLDAGKAIALMVGQTRPLWDFEDIDDNWLRVNEAAVAPVVAIPTTAGTGSEVGRASVIHDDAAIVKKIIFHPKMLPRIVIADPALTLGLSAKLTAATGMDALSHSLEAFCAPGYHPMADGIALEAMRLIKNNLIDAVQDGGNLISRSNMLCASLMGATAFQKGLGGMHALAHPLGASYDAHHGLLNAILMPYVLQYNADVLAEPMARLCHHLDIPDKSVNGFINWVFDLRQQIAIPNTLSEIGINDAKLDEIAKKAENDPSSSGNPKAMNHEDYKALLGNAISGFPD